MALTKVTYSMIDTQAVSPLDYGAVGNGTTDDTVAIQTAIDAAAAFGARTLVDLCGHSYKTTNELFIKTNTVLVNGRIVFAPTADDKIAVNIGTRNGAYLVRVGGIENVVIDTTSTNLRLTGINFGHLARGCFANNCFVSMNNGDPAVVDREHNAISISGIRTDLVVTGSGAYGNTIFECYAYNAKNGYYLQTDGYGFAGYAPEMNANFITDCSAFACVSCALYVGEGAQDNQLTVRADNFVNQIGLGTSISVCIVRGSYNIIRITEEIGTRADVQYTVAYAGNNARYNFVEYSTQQAVTATVFDGLTGNAVGKNITSDIGRPNAVIGGNTLTMTGYLTVGAGTNVVYDSIVFPANCELVQVRAIATFAPTTYTRFYFAKNGSVDTLQRLVWSTGESGAKSLVVDPTANGTIDARFIYNANEYLDISVDQDGAAGQNIRYLLVFRVLN
jgi:hypothetical protein